MQDTAISFVGGGQGHVYKYTGELITKFKGSGIMGGWTVPYSKYVTNEKGNELIERDWAADTFHVIGSTSYSAAQPWGIISKWGGGWLIQAGQRLKYMSRTQNDRWINNHQIIGESAVEVFDSNYVILYPTFPTIISKN